MSTPDTRPGHHASTPLARASHAAIVVLGLLTAIALVTAPGRDGTTFVMLALAVLMACTAVACLVPRLRVPALVTDDPDVEELGALNGAGILLLTLGRALTSRTETWWPLVVMLTALAVMTAGFVRFFRGQR